MIKIYGMKTCPDCVAVDEQVKGDSRYEVIDIGEHVRFLKEFLRLRDNNAVFAEARAKGYARQLFFLFFKTKVGTFFIISINFRIFVCPSC